MKMPRLITYVIVATLATTLAACQPGNPIVITTSDDCVHSQSFELAVSGLTANGEYNVGLNGDAAVPTGTASATGTATIKEDCSQLQAYPDGKVTVIDEETSNSSTADRPPPLPSPSPSETPSSHHAHA